MSAKTIAVIGKRPAWAKDLNDREFVFVSAYLENFRPRDAGLRAGFPASSAHTRAWEMKQRLHVRDAIDAALHEKMPALKLTIAERLMAVIGAKPEDYFKWGDQKVTETVGDGFDADGNPKFKTRKTTRQTLTLTPSSKLTPQQLAAVKGVKKRINNAGTTLELQLHDPMMAIDRIAALLNLQPREQVVGGGTVSFIIEAPDGSVLKSLAQTTSTSQIDRAAIDAQIAADAEPVEDLPPGAKPQTGLVIETP